MSPDDPIDDPVREIAAATAGISQTLDALRQRQAESQHQGQHIQDLITASLRVERALAWSSLFAACILVVVLVVLVLHVLRVL